MRKLNQEQIDIACLSYRHDFGLLTNSQQNNLRSQAQCWWEAFEKLNSSILTPEDCAIEAAHFLLCWTFQGFEAEHVQPGHTDWRVWDMDPKVRDFMNSGQQSLYDTLIAQKPEKAL